MALTEIPVELSSTPGIADSSNATAITIDSSENTTFTGDITAIGIKGIESTNGDPVLGHFYNANSGNAAESTVYITNSSTVADGLFLQAYGASATTAGGFVQDSATLGSGTGASGGLSIMTRANADMRFYTNGHTNERVRITSDGNVGIGVAAPSTSLDIVRAGVQPLRLESSSGTEVAINMVNTGGNVQLEAHSGNFNIDADSVGINTTSPSDYYADDLVVAAPDEGGITIASGATTHRGIMAFADATSGDGRYAGYVAYDHNTDAMSFHTNNGTTRATIDSSGKFNIGLTGGAGLLSVAGMMQMYTLTGVAAASGSVTLQLTQALHAGGSSKQGSMLLIIGGYGNNLTGSVQALYQVSGFMFYDHASTSSIQSISNNVSQGSVAVTRNGTGYDVTLTNTNATYTKSLVVTAILAAY